MIAIKNMEMPHSCSDCNLNYDCCGCIITGTRFWDEGRSYDFDEFEMRLSDCPLVEMKGD